MRPGRRSEFKGSAGALPPTSPSAVRRIGVSTQIKITPATRPTGADLIEFDQFTPDVSDGNVAFLDAGRVCSRHCDGNVGRFLARRPPSLPERPMVLRFWFAACFMAASTLAELP